MTPARCLTCQAVINAQKALGRTYTARQEGTGPWEVAFMGAETRRGTGATLHKALEAVAWMERKTC